MSDGEVQEGQTWEAIAAAAHHRIDNLYAIMDVNRQQCDGAMNSVMEVGDIADKIEAFGGKAVWVDGSPFNATALPELLIFIDKNGLRMRYAPPSKSLDDVNPNQELKYLCELPC